MVVHTMCTKSLLLVGLVADATAYQLGGLFGTRQRHAATRRAAPLMDGESEFGLAVDLGQKFGPTAPAHPWPKPWTNLEKQEGVQGVKAASNYLKAPLAADMQACAHRSLCASLAGGLPCWALQSRRSLQTNPIPTHQNDEIFVSKDSIHILKHHGSYMQQNRDLKKKADRDQR